MIAEILHGVDNSKVNQRDFTRLSSYGRASGEPISRIRQVIDWLIMNGSITSTNEKYAVLRLTDNSSKVIIDKEKIILKLPKQEEKIEAAKGNKSKTNKGKAIFKDIDYNLFELLRGHRLEIAREEKVPPYIIFSDKTLTDMCAKYPTDKKEMLKVNGVGETKLERYGEGFLHIIEDYLLKNPEKRSVKTNVFETTEEKRSKENNSEDEKSSEKRNKKKMPFSLDETKKPEFHDGLSISDYVELLNGIRLDGTKKLTTKPLTSWLLHHGLLEDITTEQGGTVRLASDKGLAAGIIREKRISEKGNDYFINRYEVRVQRMMYERVNEILERYEEENDTKN
jgi:ATP-dependent DNA helicase RecQ